MAYNPSIGRVLEKGGVDKFIKVVVENIYQLEDINSQDEFDAFHEKMIAQIIKDIKTNRSEELSYGQAQKPLNVFLKVFVDWSGRPTSEKANQLRKFLHVPLDSILMSEVRNRFPREYKKYVVGIYDSIREKLRIELKQRGENIKNSDLQRIIDPSNFSLNSIINKGMYYAWQNCFRNIYPEKPILLDVLWSIKRKEE